MVSVFDRPRIGFPMGRVRRFLIGRMSCQLLHRETDAPGIGNERVAGDGFEDQPLAADAVLKAQMLARVSLPPDDGPQPACGYLARRKLPRLDVKVKPVEH